MSATPITDLAEALLEENRELRAELALVRRELEALQLGRRLLLGCGGGDLK